MTSITRQQAIDQGFAIDDTCNPPVAYLGPRLDPKEAHTVVDTIEFSTPIYDGADEIDRTPVDLTTEQIQSLIDAAVRAAELGDYDSLKETAVAIGIAEEK